MTASFASPEVAETQTIQYRSAAASPVDALDHADDPIPISSNSTSQNTASAVDAELWVMQAVCHACRRNPSDLELNSCSPDEIALVE